MLVHSVGDAIQSLSTLSYILFYLQYLQKIGWILFGVLWEHDVITLCTRYFWMPSFYVPLIALTYLFFTLTSSKLAPKYLYKELCYTILNFPTLNSLTIKAKIWKSEKSLQLHAIVHVHKSSYSKTNITTINAIFFQKEK